MKPFAKITIYEIIPRLNILLTLSAVILGIYFSYNLMRPYQPLGLSNTNFKTILAELKDKESPAKAAENFVFQEEIFKKGRLFSQSGAKKTLPVKKGFILLGISVGKKNLAMLRDEGANKDYYCSEGDKIGNFTVKQILKDRVILDSGVNTLEITR